MNLKNEDAEPGLPPYVVAQLAAALERAKPTILRELMRDCVPNLFEDVGEFHRKFGLSTHRTTKPALLAQDVLEYRFKFQLEENGEFWEAHEEKDLAKAADALVDLVYVALGTAHLMGIDFNTHWALVQEKNMQKVRAASAEESKAATGRGHKLDVIKPEGWTPPDHRPILAQSINDYVYTHERTDPD